MSVCQGQGVDNPSERLGSAWRRRRFPGRHELKVRRVRPIWSGSYTRAGYLKTLVRRRARILRSGAARPWDRVAHSRLEGLNSKIRLISHRSFSFHSAAPLIALVYLCCGGLVVTPPLA